SAISTATWVTWADGRVQITGHNQQDVFFACVPQTPTGGILQGTVSDTTGVMVANARVQIIGPVTRVATTNRDGLYRFVGLPAGAYDITVTAADHNTATASGVVVDEGQTTTQGFVLTGVGIVAGTVTGSSGTPLAGARVQAAGSVTRTTTTDVNGAYSLRLPVGNYDLTVTIFAYDPGMANVDVLDGMT